MDIVIAIIVIALALYADKKKKQKKAQGKTVKPNVPNGNKSNAQNLSMPKVQTQIKNTVRTAQNTMQKNMTQKQWELKERLQQKYAREEQQVKSMQNMTSQSRNAQSKDILSRANANVQEESADELRCEDGKTPEIVVDTLQFGMAENSELMRQISDLMIMGYSGELSFERDFVAEGVAMLNSCELAEY